MNVMKEVVACVVLCVNEEKQEGKATAQYLFIVRAGTRYSCVRAPTNSSSQRVMRSK